MWFLAGHLKTSRMSKRRATSFNEAHELEYGLEISSRSRQTKEMDSVKCIFCIAFRKEGHKSSSAASSKQKQKVTENIKYFTKPFRVDNYKSHLKTHSIKWVEYEALSKE